MTAPAAAPAIPTAVVRHNRVDLALHRLRDSGGSGSGGTPLLMVHGLAEQTPAAVPDHLVAWPGPVWGLDLTGHGASSLPAGGGYTCEILMGDIDAALAHLGPAALYGRGLGAYVALLTAGARPDLVRGAILDDGPGMSGGGPEPTTPFLVGASLARTGTPDPYAQLELSQDVRPADYAATYARQATTLSGLDTAIVVCAVVRPPWLAAVTAEPGVRQLPRARCTELFLA
jgi:pimeloyl-ACP methyl ester carboxylesterase